MLGHARLDTVRLYTHPSAADANEPSTSSHTTADQARWRYYTYLVAARSAGANVKYRISSARAGSGKPRSCASSSSENTSLVAIDVPSPEEKTSQENTYPTWTLTRSKTSQPGLSLRGRDPNRCFCAGWCREAVTVTGRSAATSAPTRRERVLRLPRCAREPPSRRHRRGPPVRRSPRRRRPGISWCAGTHRWRRWNRRAS